MAKYEMKLVVVDLDVNGKSGVVRFDKIYEAETKKEVGALLREVANGDECWVAWTALGMPHTKKLSFQFYDKDDIWNGKIDGGHRPMDFGFACLKGSLKMQHSPKEAEQVHPYELIK